MSVWNPSNIIDVAESVGIPTLSKDVADNLARDVEFRLGQVLEEALKFMRHGKRTTLGTQDVSQALRALDVEPLYGYDTLRPLRFGEASIGPGQPLFYVEDEEVDFEKLINAPLPRVPREVSFTAHWLAVEGVQPSIPQNPTTDPSSSSSGRHQDLLPKGPNSTTLAAANGYDNVAVKPLVKHILSAELQLYFERVTSAVLDEANDEYRLAALASLRADPGLHQLVPYFVQFVAEKVTHGLGDLFVLTQMMHLTAALLENPSLFVEPYVAAVVPPVLTCLVGKRLGGAAGLEGRPPRHFALRDLAAGLLVSVARKYGRSSHTLKPRLARTCLKHWLDPNKPFGTHYGAIVGLLGLAGAEGVRALIMPNLRAYDGVVKEGLQDEGRRGEAEMVVSALVRGVEMLAGERMEGVSTVEDGEGDGEGVRERLVEKVGEVVGGRVFESGRQGLIQAVLESDVSL